MRPLLALALLAASAITAGEPAPATAAEALRIGWPRETGPLWTFGPLPSKVALVMDPSKATVLWHAEDVGIGRSKGGSKGFRTVDKFTEEAMAKHGSHPGNWGGLIVADGRVYAASWRPTGPVATVEGNKIRIDAEDLVVALDALTGKVLWQSAEPGGMLTGGGKRKAVQVTPVWHQGVVFSLGSTMRLFAHDAASGKRLWMSEVHPLRAAAAKRREEILELLAQGRFAYDLLPDRITSLVVVGGMLIVPDFQGGLLGVDPKDGTRRWSLKGVNGRSATPSAWTNAGREYLLVANDGGVLRLIDPVAGTELWKVDGLGPNCTTLTPGRTHVLVNIEARSLKEKDVPGRLGAIRLSPERGTRTWDAPADHLLKIGGDSGARNLVCYSQGRFLLPHRWALTVGGAPAAGAKDDGKEEDEAPKLPAGAKRPMAYLLDEETGKVLWQERTPEDERKMLGGLIYWYGDQLLARGDSAHGPSHGGRHPWTLWQQEDQRVRRVDGVMDLCEFDTGYEVLQQTPLVAGLLFERTLHGGIMCMDLRRR